MVYTDRLLEYNNDEVKMKLAQGLITRQEEVIHASGAYVINNLSNSTEGFFDLPIEKQKELMLIEIEKITPID